MRNIRALLLCCSLLAACAHAETCITQSQLTGTERDTLVRVGTDLATLTQAGNVEGVRSRTMPEYARDFAGIQDAIRSAAPHLQQATFVPESIFVLDASGNKAGGGGSAQDAQFSCSLNHSAHQVSFLIPALPAGRYALVVLDSVGTAEPWQIAMLLQQSAPGTWQLGGLFPRATSAGGHDGLWYWRNARDFANRKQPWNAFVYFTEAEQLLRPVVFLTSTNLDVLQDERTRSAPPALSAGIGAEQPLVLAPAKGDEVRVTSLRAETAPDKSGIDLLAHIQAGGALADPVASRARNASAARALIAAYPELRTAFHGVWIVADLPGGGTYVSEEPMGSL